MFRSIFMMTTLLLCLATYGSASATAVTYQGSAVDLIEDLQISGTYYNVDFVTANAGVFTNNPDNFTFDTQASAENASATLAGFLNSLDDPSPLVYSPGIPGSVDDFQVAFGRTGNLYDYVRFRIGGAGNWYTTTANGVSVFRNGITFATFEETSGPDLVSSEVPLPSPLFLSVLGMALFPAFRSTKKR